MLIFTITATASTGKNFDNDFYQSDNLLDEQWCDPPTTSCTLYVQAVPHLLDC